MSLRAAAWAGALALLYFLLAGLSLGAAQAPRRLIPHQGFPTLGLRR